MWKSKMGTSWMLTTWVSLKYYMYMLIFVQYDSNHYLLSMRQELMNSSSSIWVYKYQHNITTNT